LHFNGQHGVAWQPLQAELRQRVCREAQPHVDLVAPGVDLAPSCQVQACRGHTNMCKTSYQ
jgi:hypothetical protein